jgi:iron complex transport system ATP-binding protein
MIDGLDVSGLTFSYVPGTSLLVDVDVEVQAGQIACLLGPNGAGKTSLIRCVVGLARPEGGSVRVNGDEVTQMSPPELARRVAYLPQAVETAFAFSVIDMVVTGRTAYVPFGRTPDDGDLELAYEALSWVGIGHLAHRPFNRLSGGERQLCGIARALAQSTSVMVLDEPTSALDYGNQVRVLGIIRELADSGKAVLMTSHAPNHALESADVAVLLSQGRVVAAGDPAAVIDSETLSDLYGVRVAVTETETPFGLHRVCIPEIAVRAATRFGSA